MIDNNLKGLLQTIREDKATVLKGLRKQDQDRTYKTPEVIDILELSFALVEASIMTKMEEALNNSKLTTSPIPGHM